MTGEPVKLIRSKVPMMHTVCIPVHDRRMNTQKPPHFLGHLQYDGYKCDRDV